MERVDKIWLDGRFVGWDEANIHILTHTLHYGLGVFEGIRCYRNEEGTSFVFRLKEHVDRLFDSARIVQLEVPFSRDEIGKAIIETIRVNNLKECYIRPIVFLGDGSMGLFPRNNLVRVAIAVWPWGAYLGEEGITKGIRVKISSYTRLHVNANMTKAKVCGNYVNSILAKREAVSAGYDEALLLDADGYVCEGSGENIFMVKGGEIKTPSLTSVLRGITRDSVITIARDKGIRVVEDRFTRDELYTADEAFFTGTAAEITPIREVDGRVIGEGRPGPITKALQTTFFDVVRGKVERYRDWLTAVS